MKSLVTNSFILSLIFGASFAMANGAGQENCQTGPSKVSCEVVLNDDAPSATASTSFSPEEIEPNAYGCNVIKKAGNYTLIFAKQYSAKNTPVTNRFDVTVCPGNCGLQEPGKKAVNASATLVGDTKEGKLSVDIFKGTISKDKVSVECSIH